MNDYEAPTILKIGGQAHDLVLGSKPYLPNSIESEGWIDSAERVNDIDETDE